MGLLKSRRFYLYILDHGFLRSLYSNAYQLPGGLIRANQPSPQRLSEYQRDFGIKTVFNLRGGNTQNPAWRLESQACSELGLKMIDLRFLSRSFPHKEDIFAAREAIRQADYPALAHCKSGADRAGFFSVLYRIYRLGEPVAEAMSELGPKFGHFRWSKTGVLDEFFEAYLEAHRTTNIGFDEWVEQAYDRNALSQKYVHRGVMYRLGDFLVDRILRRE
jgi:protein tyrosine/serine phosphatase